MLKRDFEIKDSKVFFTTPVKNDMDLPQVLVQLDSWESEKKRVETSIEAGKTMLKGVEGVELTDFDTQVKETLTKIQQLGQKEQVELKLKQELDQLDQLDYDIPILKEVKVKLEAEVNDKKTS